MDGAGDSGPRARHVALLGVETRDRRDFAKDANPNAAESGARRIGSPKSVSGRFAESGIRAHAARTNLARAAPGPLPMDRKTSFGNGSASSASGNGHGNQEVSAND